MSGKVPGNAPTLTLPRRERELLVATGNSGKLREYQELLKGAPFELVSLRDVGITDEVEETGETFAENAWLKAAGYAGMSGLLTLADDSGLEVDALGGDPGVRSARYGAGDCRTDEDRVALLLRNLRGVPWERRTARFRCVINVVRPSAGADGAPELLVSVVGAVAGMVQYEPAGDDGFGYDPVVYLPSFKRTVAQLSLEQKNQVSHRGNASARAMQALLRLSF